MFGRSNDVLRILRGATCFVGPPEYLMGEGQKRVRATPETLTTPPEWVTFQSLVALRSYKAAGFHAGFYGKDASGTTDAERIGKLKEGIQALGIRSCMEFEADTSICYKIFSKFL
ncbi:hypothetical protein Nepgr_023561 [Nepenthes gracilis]|uniref:Uncharacterized protein n=1 Tax=Nepenthes gracilis TaxID=150966 RepID=A0AAD3XZ60_NEPGR|nr:hypothetical protein Nepgr_023561 [Nepenthes gracilis]